MIPPQHGDWQHRKAPQAWTVLIALLKHGALKKGNECYYWWDDRCIAPLFGRQTPFEVVSIVRSRPMACPGQAGFPPMNPTEILSAGFEIEPAESKQPCVKARKRWRDRENGVADRVIELGTNLLGRGQWHKGALGAVGEDPYEGRIIWDSPEESPIIPTPGRFRHLFLSLLYEGYLPAKEVDDSRHQRATDETSLTTEASGAAVAPRDALAETAPIPTGPVASIAEGAAVLGLLTGTRTRGNSVKFTGENRA
jgi:hypothetical protein